MFYRNDDPSALYAMEEDRLGHCGEDGYDDDSYYSAYNRYWDVMADEKFEEARDER